MQRGIGKKKGGRAHESWFDVRIEKKKTKTLGKIKIVYAVFGLSNRNDLDKRFYLSKQGKFPTCVDGVVKISRLYLSPRPFIPLPSLFFHPFSVSIEFPVSSPRPRCMCCHLEMENKKKKKKNEGDGINESNSRTICRVYLCFYFRVRSRACLK